MQEQVDALVVGSGFGASVAAYRLAEAGKSVVVMERGRRYGPGDFARTPAEMGKNFWDPSERLYGLFDAWTFRGLEGLVSSGLGGGSLIYANVLLRKDEAWFVHESPIPGGGYENWPFSRADLDPHYDEVEKMLGATRYPYQDTPKTMALEQAAHDLGLSIQRPPIAVTFAPRPGEEPGRNLEIPVPEYGNIHGRRRVTCTLCGECDIGCNTGAKNTLDHTYLSAAANHGAHIRTLHEVRGIRPLPSGGYEARYVVHDPEATGETATRTLPEQTIRARKLILGAGTFGSTFLLMRSRPSLPGLGAALGSRFSGNGDLLTVLMNCKTPDGAPHAVAGGLGPVITTAIRVGDSVDGDGSTGRGYYVEDAGFPSFTNWLVEVSQVRSLAKRFGAIAWQVMANRIWAQGKSNISKDLAAALGPGTISACSLPLLGMGRDVPDGEMTLSHGRLAINWTLTTSEEYFSRVRETMESVGDALGADFHDNPLWWARRVITVHPLGGAPAGRHSAEGVCDAFGEVFGHPGLFVLDGAAMPGPVGANPALTIAAVADRACTRMLGQPWEGSPGAPGQAGEATPGQTPAGEAAPGKPDEGQTLAGQTTPGVSVSFTEKMRGYVGMGETDPERGALIGRSHRDHLMFELTITAEDIEAFVADPLHRATATGYVDGAALGGRLPVERGWFNLFVHPEGTASRRMLYRLWLSDGGGTPLTFVGYKDVTDDPGIDLWTDTTTLYVHILAGHVPPPPADTPEAIAAAVAAAGGDQTEGGEVRGAGVLVIKPLDFAKQMTTFRTSGPSGPLALAAFGRLFVGELWDVYVAGKMPGRGKDKPSRQGSGARAGEGGPSGERSGRRSGEGSGERR